MTKTSCRPLFFLLLALSVASPALTASKVIAQEPAAVAAESEPSTAPRAVTVEDYGRFEQLGFRRELSPDGRWAAVPIQRVDGSSELQLLALDPSAAGDEPLVFADGSSPAFSSDSRWLVYRIGRSEAERERLSAADEPVRDDLGLLRLGDSDPAVIEGVQRSAISGSGRYVAMQRYAAEDAETATLVVRDLDAEADLSFGNVVQFAWQDEGDLLALIVSTSDEVGNGVQLYEAATGALRVLDSGRHEYTGLSWREAAADLAYLQAVKTEDWEGQTNRLVVWKGLDSGGARSTLDPARVEVIDPAWGITAYAAPEWSDEGHRVFFSLQRREVIATDDDAAESVDTEDEAPSESPAETESNVQIWHSRDERIQPMQRVFEDRDRERGYLAVWNLAADRVVQLGTDRYESIDRVPGDRWVVESDRSPYRDANRFDLERHDYWLVDVDGGDRRRVIEGVTFYEGPSAGGRYLLYFLGADWLAYDIDEDRTVNLTADLPAQFVDTDYDTPTRHGDPPWGAGGWLEGDVAVLLYDRFDLWAVRPGGVGALRVTEGAEEAIRHRVATTDGLFFFQRDNEPLSSDPLWLNLYGERTKRSGYARVRLGSDAPGAGMDTPGVERLLWLDARLSGLQKADEAERYVWVEERYDDSPDLFVAGPDLADARQLTATNAFAEEFFWGRAELIDYRNSVGEALQGALYYPADYDPDRTYPMIVYVYERLSQGLHSYTVPSERSPYNTAVFSAEGYFVLRPDIVFRDRDPGISATDAVTAAVDAVLATGKVDPDRVGLVGHSWGGYEAAFVPTQTDHFAASVAGAALTNFFSMFGTIHWNQGMPESAHFETGQARMEVPYWEDMEAYARNSPVMHITELETPMLLFFGDSDGTVDWHQGVEMYNYARRAGKFLVMLVYPGENHSASRKENQIDYHHRVLEWFGHFLQGREAPGWITDGEPVVVEPQAAPVESR